MIERLAATAGAGVLLPVLLFSYLALGEWVTGRLPEKRKRAIRPWIWLAPAVVFVGVFEVFPLVNSIVLSMFDARSEAWRGFDNYVEVLTDPTLQMAVRNSGAWLVLLTGLTVTLGLTLAVLMNGIRFEGLAKAVMFMPLAISFVAAGVIWRFMYDYRPAGAPQTGTLNGVLAAIGEGPTSWLVNSPLNNLALIVAAVWMFTGFALVVLSAALKGLPRELLEAARVDGASEWQVQTRIVIPLLAPTIAVVTTTMAISAVKAFDIVYVMTNGNFDTDVLATRMYKELFSARDFGHASVIAVIMLIAVLPVMVWNLRVYRQQELTR